MMNHFSNNPFLVWLLHASWQASILVLVVGAVQWVFRDQLAPRWRHALWFLVVLRLVLPISPPSALSLFNFLQPKRASVTVNQSPPAAENSTSLVGKAGE